MPIPFPKVPATLRPFAKLVELGTASKWLVFGSLVGFLGGLAGITLHWLIGHAADWSLRQPLDLAGEGVGGVGARWWLLLVVPTLGGLVTGWIVSTFSPESSGHGTDSVVDSFHRGRGRVRKRVIVAKAVTSAITIGSGGSAGQEGPIAQVGSGIGSTLAEALRLGERDRRILLLSGASAGIGAMFSAPLGGALFMPEVLYGKSEFEGEALVPCIISSIVGHVTYTAFTGREQAIALPARIYEELQFRDARELPLYLVLGLLCALVGFLYVRFFYGVHDAMRRLRRVPRMLHPAIGGLLLGATALAVAPIAGDQGVLFGGYGLIQSAIQGGLPVAVMLVLLVAKILATTFSIATGGSGGVFAPSLAIGALLGGVVGTLAQQLLPGLDVHPASFALVGMGGFFAGVAKVPIAAVVIVCEMTGDYGLLAPLMLVSVLHLLLSQRWSLYRAQVPSQIDSPAHAGDFVIDVLERMKVADLMTGALRPRLIHHLTTLRQVLKTVADAKESYFPVVDEDERLVGIFSLTDLRRIYLEDVVEDVVIVRDFMIEHVITATMEDSLDEVLRRMTAHNINAIPIVEPDGAGRVLALLERNDLGRAYAQRLRELKGDGAA